MKNFAERDSPRNEQRKATVSTLEAVENRSSEASSSSSVSEKLPSYEFLFDESEWNNGSVLDSARPTSAICSSLGFSVDSGAIPSGTHVLDEEVDTELLLAGQNYLDSVVSAQLSHLQESDVESTAPVNMISRPIPRKIQKKANAASPNIATPDSSEEP